MNMQGRGAGDDGGARGRRAGATDSASTAASASAAGDGPAPWLAIKAGDWLSFRDEGNFVAGGAGGLDYLVRSRREIEARDRDSGNPVAAWTLYDLEAPDRGECRFVVFHSGEEFELRFYFAPAFFARGTRNNLIDRAQTWFFLPPPDPEDFIASTLEWAPWPDLPPFDAGDGVEAQRSWGPSGFGQTVYGFMDGDDGEDLPVQLFEYATEDDSPNSLLLLIEERWMRPDGAVPPEGGFVSLLVGRRIAQTDVTHLPT